MSVTRTSLSRNSPAFRAVAITPADGTDLTNSGIRAIYVGGTGDLLVRGLQDTVTATFKAVPVGTVIAICPSRVMGATTATFLVGLI